LFTFFLTFTGLKYDGNVIILGKDKFYEWYHSIMNAKNKRTILKESLFDKFYKKNQSNTLCKMTNCVRYIKITHKNKYYLLGDDIKKIDYINTIGVKYGFGFQPDSNKVCDLAIYTRYDWNFVDKKYFVRTISE
jgi:hypothetical protein